MRPVRAGSGPPVHHRPRDDWSRECRGRGRKPHHAECPATAGPIGAVPLRRGLPWPVSVRVVVCGRSRSIRCCSRPTRCCSCSPRTWPRSPWVRPTSPSCVPPRWRPSASASWPGLRCGTSGGGPSSPRRWSWSGSPTATSRTWCARSPRQRDVLLGGSPCSCGRRAPGVAAPARAHRGTHHRRQRGRLMLVALTLVDIVPYQLSRGSVAAMPDQPARPAPPPRARVTSTSWSSTAMAITRSMQDAAGVDNDLPTWLEPRASRSRSTRAGELRPDRACRSRPRST